MSWGAALFGLNLLMTGLSSYSAGQSRRNAAIAQNKAQKKLNKAQYERDLQTSEIDYLNALVGHAYRLAENEALRYKDDVKKADYEKQQSNIINAALQNLGLNTDALTDQYVTAEEIRYQDEMRDLLYQTGKLGIGREGEQLKSGVDRARSQQTYRSSSKASQMQTRDTVSTAKGLYKLNKKE